MENNNEEKIKFANWLFAGEANFVAGANNKGDLPKLSLPEVAFLGRSNVGKSSLINGVTNRHKLARVSHTPGATKQINFFSIRDKLTIVDLPGHGYAKVSKSQMYDWSKLIKGYLKNSINLQRVFILIDSRRGIMYSDELLFDLLDDIGVMYQIVLTKCDKVSKSEIEKLFVDIKEKMIKHQAFYSNIIPTSVRDSTGIQGLRVELAQFIKI